MGIKDLQNRALVTEDALDPFADVPIVPITDGLRSPVLSQGVDTPPPTSPLALPTPKKSFLDRRFESLAPSKADQLEQVGRTMSVLGDDNPETVAKNESLASETGLPVQAVENDPAGAETTARIRRAQKVLETSPILRNKLQEPQFLRSIQDDIDGLAWWETTFRDITFGFTTGLETRELGLLGSKEARGTATESDIKERKVLQESIRSRPQGDGFLESAANLVGQMIGGIPKILERSAEGAAVGATTALIAGQVGPQVAVPEEFVTVPAGALIGAKVGGATAIVEESQKIESGHVFLDMVEQGVDRDNARLISEGVGVVNGVLELVGVSKVTAPFRKQFGKMVSGQLKDRLTGATRSQALKNGLKAYATAVGTESATEVAQEIVSITGEEFAKVIDEKQFESLVGTEQGREEISNRLLTIFETVSKGMAILAIPGAGVQFIGDSRKAQKADENVKVMEALGEHAAESKSIERVPEQFKEYVREVTKDGPITDVYVDAGKLQEYFQSVGLDADAVIQGIPEIEEDLQTAVATGQDIRIPIEAYAANIAGTEHHAAILEHSRFDPNQDMTPFEAKEFRANEQERFETEASKVLEEKAEDQVFQDSANQVRDVIKDQILGREGVQQFPEFVADQYADLYQAFAVSMAGKFGGLPHEVFERMGLNIQTQPEEGEVLAQEARKVTQTPEFQKFFEGSQVVDEQGQPQVVFHGTNQDFDSFQKTPGKGAAGFHFGSPEQAQTAQSLDSVNPQQLEEADIPKLLQDAGFDIREISKPSGRIIPVFLSIKNPARLHDTGFIAGKPFVDFLDPENRAKIPQEFIEALQEKGLDNSSDLIVDALKAAGFDGIVYENLVEGAGESFVAFEPTQIKSIFNSGAFDPNDPNILNQGPVESVLRNLLRKKAGPMVLPKGKNNEPGTLIIQGEKGPETIKDFNWSPDIDAENYGMPERRETIPAGDPLLQQTHLKEGREELHKEIENTFFDKLGPIPLGRQPIVYIMGGGAASGKGSVVKLLRKEGKLPAEGQVQAIDADEIKLHIPEYKAIQERGDSRAADITHEESSRLARNFEARSLAERRDLIIDRTLGSKDQLKIARQIKAFKDQDYEVRIIGVSVDTAEAVIRSEARATQNGRFVPISRLISAHKEFSRNHASYAEIADEFTLYNNMERKPFVMAQKGGAGLDIIAPEEYTVFVNKKEGNEDAKTLREIQPETVGSSQGSASESSGRRLERGNAGNAGRDSQTQGDQAQENALGLPGLPQQLFQSQPKDLKTNPTPEDITALQERIKSELNLQVFSLTFNKRFNAIQLETIIVPKADRKQGAGTKAMQDLTAFADEHGLNVFLRPAIRDDFHGTTSRSRLVKFYKAHGFKENKGRKKDFALPLSAAMVREPVSDGKLFQSKKDKRGSIAFPDPDFAVISLFENADLSTFLHESGHFFFENYRVLASQAETPQIIKDDMQKLLDFVGVDSLDIWNSLSFEERRAAHEQVAISFEAYLFEGKAPSQPLRRLFQRFRSWLVQVYRNISSLNVNLTDEVRGVFDRMLATDEQIESRKRSQAYEPIFTNKVDAGMNEQEWAEYTALVNEEDAEGKNELSKRSVKNMQWLSRAKSRELRKLQRQNRDTRRDFKKQAEVVVSEMPVYKAKEFLSGPVEKVKKAKSDKNKVTPEVDSLFTAVAKLGGISKEEAIQLWGLDPQDKPKSGAFGKPVVRVKGGVPIDIMAERLGTEGYLPVDENGKADTGDFEDKFFLELFGRKQFSTINQEFEFAEEFAALGEKEGIDPETQKHGKLSLVALQDIYGNEENAIWRQLPTGRFGIVTEEGGFHPELVAETFGFGSGDEMIKAILEAPKKNEAIEQETTRRVLEVFGDLNSPEALEAGVNEAIHNQVRTKMVHVELRAISKRTGSGNILKTAAKEFAENRIQRTKVRNVKPFQYQSAERRAGRKAFEAIQKGNSEEAIAFKRTEVINHHFAREALRAEEEIRKAIKFFKKFDSASTRKNLDQDYLDQIDKLLEVYEFKKITLKEIDRRKSLNQWISEQTNQGLDPVIDDRLLEDLQRKNFKEASVEELLGLRDAVKNIEHLGRLKNKLLTLKRQRDLNQAVALGVKSITENSKGKRKSTIEPRALDGALARETAKFLASHRKIASLARQMDGFKDGGAMWELFIQPLNTQSNIESVEREKASERLGEIFKVYSSKEMRSLHNKTYFDFLDTEQVNDKSLSKAAILSLALNWGNAENRQRISTGYKWSPDQVAKILDTLEEKDWTFVQNIWDYVNEFWPQIEAKEKRVTGVAPEKVEALGFQTRFGTMQGGYYPIVYDSLQSTRAYADARKEALERAMKGNYTRQTTKRNHVKERVEAVDRPVRLDLGVIFEHVETVIHDLAFHEYLIDATRLLRHEDMQKAIIDNYGQNTFRVMNDTIQDVAVGEIAAQNMLEKTISWIRTGSSIAAMGWNFGTAFLQPLGLTVSMSRVGPKWVAKGLSRWMTGAVGAEGGVSFIHEKSSMMRLRHKTFQREINEVRNKLGSQSAIRRVLGPAEDSYFWLIGKAQMVADVPTWFAQYEKSMAAGENESQAVDLADQAVLDSQGSGLVKDLSGIQRGGQFMRLWTNFYSYFNVVWNNNAEAFGRVKINDPISIGRLASDLFFINILPATLTFVLREAVIKGECDHGRDLACSAKKIARENASYTLGQLFIIRELSGAAAGFTGYEGPAGSRVTAEASKLLIQIQQLEADKALFRSLNQTAGILLHYPAGQVDRVVQGFIKLDKGETKNPLAPVFGVSNK